MTMAICLRKMAKVRAATFLNKTADQKLEERSGKKSIATHLLQTANLHEDIKRDASSTLNDPLTAFSC